MNKLFVLLTVALLFFSSADCFAQTASNRQPREQSDDSLSMPGESEQVQDTGQSRLPVAVPSGIYADAIPLFSVGIGVAHISGFNVFGEEFYENGFKDFSSPIALAFAFNVYPFILEGRKSVFGFNISTSFNGFSTGGKNNGMLGVIWWRDMPKRWSFQMATGFSITYSKDIFLSGYYLDPGITFKLPGKFDLFALTFDIALSLGAEKSDVTSYLFFIVRPTLALSVVVPQQRKNDSK